MPRRWRADVGESDGFGGIVRIVVFVGEDGWSGADGQHDGAVGSDRVGAAVGGPFRLQLLAVFHPIVATASDSGIDLVGVAVVDPFVSVIDLAPFGRKVTAGVFAVFDEQHRCLAGRAGEQPLFATLVDDHTVGVDHHSADVSGDLESRCEPGGRRRASAGSSRGRAPYSWPWASGATCGPAG